MRINTSEVYAVLAVGYIAQHKDEGVITSDEISKQYNIPPEYLLRVLQQLTKANILRSKRGPRGGYSLARPLKKISLLSIIKAVDGPMVSRLDMAEHARGDKFGARAEQIYKKAIAQARSVFEKSKLSDMLGG